MRKIVCNTCGDDVYLLERGERQTGPTSKETPLDHMRRTGHDPREPVRMACRDCQNVWHYGGDADRPTCPNCKGKAVVPADELLNEESD
jgi:DnaJ-class molecular chaperone